MYHLLAILILLLPTLATASDIERILTERNTITLLLSPYKATRIVFPYKVDSPFIDPAFTFTNTAPAIFATNSIEQMEGQDVFVITTTLNPVDAQAFARHEASIAMSFDGYYLTLKLRTTTNTREHTDNLFLTLSKTDRRKLINKEIAREKKRLADIFKQKEQQLDEKIKTQSFLLFAENGNRGEEVSLYFEKEDFQIGNVVVDFYIDNKVIYEKAGIKTYVLIIRNQSSKAISFSSFALLVDDDTTLSQTSCNRTLLADTKITCTFATLDNQKTDETSFKLSAATDSGSFDILLDD